MLRGSRSYDIKAIKLNMNRILLVILILISTGMTRDPITYNNSDHKLGARKTQKKTVKLPLKAEKMSDDRFRYQLKTKRQKVSYESTVFSCKNLNLIL